MTQEMREKVGWALLEVFSTTAIALAPLFAAAFLTHIDKSSSFGTGVSRFGEFISEGQLYLYAFCALGPVSWLYMARFRNAHVGYRVLFGLIIISIFLVSFSIYTHDPDMKSRLAIWVSILSVLAYFLCPVLNFFLLLMEDERPPAPDEGFNANADKLIQDAGAA